MKPIQISPGLGYTLHITFQCHAAKPLAVQSAFGISLSNAQCPWAISRTAGNSSHIPHRLIHVTLSTFVPSDP